MYVTCYREFHGWAAWEEATPYKISTPPVHPSCREVAEKVVHCATGSAQHFENNIK